jgi:glyoxylase-like metal-dependent hydrolase (beta-lactamase superfamily II)
MPTSRRTFQRNAWISVLTAGYVGERVASTVSYVEEGAMRAIVDPGMVASRGRILRPLARLGVEPGKVTDVVLSHHHPDHTVNCALFPRARIHDFWAIYEADRWTSRPADGFLLSPSVLLLETPGHTPQDITTVVGTESGVVAFTHLWWDESGPKVDPLATDPIGLEVHRADIRRLADLIVPGHGKPFAAHAPGVSRPHRSTPRGGSRP